MARSVRKGPYVDHYVVKKVEETLSSLDKNAMKSIKIWSRRSTILPRFVGITFLVHNGKKHVPVRVIEDMVGYKFGEFAPTRVSGKSFVDKKIKKK